VFSLAAVFCARLFTVLFSGSVLARTPPAAVKPAVFRVKYIADGSVYIDAGHNADIQEGMKLSVIEPPQDGVAPDGVRVITLTAGIGMTMCFGLAEQALGEMGMTA